MKYKWLNKNNNDKLIIFFNGWGMDESVVKHLEFEDYDVIMYYDYNDLYVDFSEIETYKSRNLIAWSMGVMLAAKFNLKTESATAVNGTLTPIDAKYGINPRIYDLTIRGFNEQGREKFIKSMFDKPVEIKINRTLENQKSELEAIKTYSADTDFKYNRIIISSDDKIIPTKSQCAFWNLEPNINSGHCPFLLFSKWSELL